MFGQSIGSCAWSEHTFLSGVGKARLGLEIRQEPDCEWSHFENTQKNVDLYPLNDGSHGTFLKRENHITSLILSDAVHRKL